MNHEDAQVPPADAGRLEAPVRPRVVRVRYHTGSSKTKPKAGDRRTTKMHGLQIRVQCMARDFRTGAPIGRIVRAGRPVFDWRKPIELDPWDHYLLTADERAALAGRTGGKAA